MGLILLFRNTKSIVSFANPIKTVVSKIDTLISSPFRFLSSADSNIKDLFNTYAENKKLKARIQELENQEDLVQSLTEENEKLTQEIDNANLLVTKTSVIGKVIVRSPVSWYDALTVELGKNAKVSPKMLVVANGALLGLVSEVNASTASVTLLSSGSDFNLPIKIVTTNGDVYGLLKSYDVEKKQFLITNLNTSSPIQAGDRVVTSGLDGDTVANVAVGEVASVKDHTSNGEQEIYVTPLANFSEISYVTIIGD